MPENVGESGFLRTFRNYGVKRSLYGTKRCIYAAACGEEEQHNNYHRRFQMHPNQFLSKYRRLANPFAKDRSSQNPA